MKSLFSKIKQMVLELLTIILFPFFKKRLKGQLIERYDLFGVEATNVCNSRCSFCAYRLNQDERPKRTCDPEVLDYCLKLCQEAGEDNLSYFSFFGDPLTDPELLAKIKKIRNTPGIDNLSLYTNLIGLGRFDIEDFVNSGITVLNISICLGGEEMYKRLFGVDKYSQVLDNLFKLLEANQKFKEPIDITLLLRMDYPNFKFIDKDLLEKITQYLPESRLDVFPADLWEDYSGVITADELPKGASFRKIDESRRIPCYALYRKIQVLSDGRISACSCHFGPDLIVDNIFNYQSLDEFWHSKALAEFRDRWEKGEIPESCKKCLHYSPFSRLIKKRLKNMIWKKWKKLFSK